MNEFLSYRIFFREIDLGISFHEFFPVSSIFLHESVLNILGIQLTYLSFIMFNKILIRDPAKASIRLVTDKTMI